MGCTVDQWRELGMYENITWNFSTANAPQLVPSRKFIWKWLSPTLFGYSIFSCHIGILQG